MKKLLTITVVLTLFICSTAMAQASVGLSYNNRGVGFQAGFLSEAGIELQVGYKLPLIRTDVPTLAYGTVGYSFKLTENEDGDGLYIEPLVGMANYKVKDFSVYEKTRSTMDIINVNKMAGYYRVEAGIQRYKGRAFIEGSYCESFYFGVGMKILFKDF